MELKESMIQGKWQTREVWINSKPLLPDKSQKVWNHAPDGFNWSYGGSGTAQLALAILLEFVSEAEAVRWHLRFKGEMIPLLEPKDFQFCIGEVEAWIKRKREEKED